MAIGCLCGVGVIVAWGADGYRVSVGWGVIVAWGADGYRVSVWSGSDSILWSHLIDWSTPKSSLYRQFICYHLFFPPSPVVKDAIWLMSF